MFDMAHAHSVNRAQQRSKHEGHACVQKNPRPKYVLSYCQKSDGLNRDENQQAMNARLDGWVNARFLLARVRRHLRIAAWWRRGRRRTSGHGLQRFRFHSHWSFFRFLRRSARHIDRLPALGTVNRDPRSRLVDKESLPALVTGKGNVHVSGQRPRAGCIQRVTGTLARFAPSGLLASFHFLMCGLSLFSNSSIAALISEVNLSCSEFSAK